MSLSRFALMLAGAIIVFAIIGVWAGAPLAGAWRWPAALLIAFVVWERIRLTQAFTLHRQIASTLALGLPISYTLTISNTGKSPLRLETQVDYPDRIEGDNSLQSWQLQAGASQSRQFPLTPLKLGPALLGRLYLKQLGVFGLCWWTRAIDDSTGFNVEPVRLDQVATVPSLTALGNRHRHKAGNGLELLDLRDYRHGDPLRSIDWKASARRGKPITRRFEREQRLEIIVLIDCGRGSRLQCGQLDRLHNYVNVAAKLAEFTVLQGDHIGCLAYAQQIVDRAPVAGGMMAVNRIRQLLGHLSAGHEEANALNAALEARRLLKHRGLVVFLTGIEQPEAAAQLIQAGQLLAPQHQVLVGCLEDPAIGDILKRSARQWQDPYRHFAALEYQKGRQATCLQLQRHGVAVAPATARHLDQQVLAYYQNQRGTIAGA